MSDPAIREAPPPAAEPEERGGKFSMTDQAIIEAAARAMAGYVWPGEDELHHDLAERVLAAATPLIRADALEEAATRLLELAREERNLDAATINRAAEYLDTLRALKVS